jgi:hypothetical protein
MSRSIIRPAARLLGLLATSLALAGTAAAGPAGRHDHDLERAAVTRVQGQNTCPQPCSATPYADVVLFTVPAGKRLVIEHVSGFVTLPAGTQALYSLKTATAGTYLVNVPYPGVALDHLLGPVTQAGTAFSTSNALRLYADAGTDVVFHVFVVAGTGAIDYVLASFSGYLIDA